jgi:hypothetical protein
MLTPGLAMVVVSQTVDAVNDRVTYKELLLTGLRMKLGQAT